MVSIIFDNHFCWQATPEDNLSTASLIVAALATSSGGSSWPPPTAWGYSEDVPKRQSHTVSSSCSRICVFAEKLHQHFFCLSVKICPRHPCHQCGICCHCLVWATSAHRAWRQTFMPTKDVLCDHACPQPPAASSDQTLQWWSFTNPEDCKKSWLYQQI